MLKVADINISEDNCGLYVIRLRGIDAQYFQVINKELFFLLEDPYICKTFYTVTVSIEDLANRFTPKIVTYYLNANNCQCTTTTTTTSTTTTTINPFFPTTSTTTTTTGTTISPTCFNRLSLYPNGITNLTNYGSYYIGTVTGTFGGNIWGDNNVGYTDDSRFSTAAVHAGLVTVGQTVTLRFNVLGLKTNFPSVTANGITSLAWPTSWCAIQMINMPVP